MLPYGDLCPLDTEYQALRDGLRRENLLSILGDLPLSLDEWNFAKGESQLSMGKGELSIEESSYHLSLFHNYRY